MKVLVADSINEKGIENLKAVADVVVDTTITPEELANTIHEYNGIVVRSRTKLTKDILKNADNMQIIARAGVGVDNIDLDAATEKGIMVVNSPESTSVTVAEHTMGLILSMARKISIADKLPIGNHSLNINYENEITYICLYAIYMHCFGSLFICLYK